METLKLWIARDKNGALWVFKRKPVRNEKSFDIDWGVHERMFLDESQFPEVTWANSPQEIEIKLINTGNQD